MQYRINLIYNNKVLCHNGDPASVVFPTDDTLLLSMDGSTSLTGLSIFRVSDGVLIGTIYAKRSTSDRDAVDYKVKLKDFLRRFLSAHRNIAFVAYELPFIGYTAATERLFMLKPILEEIKLESTSSIIYTGDGTSRCESVGSLSYLDIGGFNNMQWKRNFLRPRVCPEHTENQKKAIAEKVKSMPEYNIVFSEGYEVTQDELDSIGLGHVAVREIQKNGSFSEIRIKKNQKPFKFNIEFFTLDADEDFEDTPYEFITDLVPDAVISNGIECLEFNGRNGESFEQTIYNRMNGEDKLLIFKVALKSSGNVVLKYRIGALAKDREYVYALIWRTRRKKGVDI